MSKFLIVLFILVPFVSFGQTKINPKKIDADLLNDLILKEVNALRNRKRLDTLRYDEPLNKAADDHASYMSDNEIVTHDQKSKIKRGPYDRVVYYDGAHNAVGENVQSYNLEKALKKSKNKLTYEKLAKDIVKVWVKSRPHYENLINPEFKTMGHKFQLNDGILYCCQVFGSEPFQANYEFEKGEDFTVKNKKECFDCKKIKEKIYNDEVSLGWYTVSNDSIFYWNMNNYVKRRFYIKKKEKYLLNVKRNNLRKVFKAGGIITIDLIHNEQFDCKGKTSFHNSLYHNGYYLNSIDKAIVQSENISTSPNLVQVFVGMKPAFKDTFFQVDFNLIKKKRPCIRTSTIYVRPDYLEPDEYFVMPKPSVSLDKKLIIEDSVITKISYERNQTNQDTSIFQPLISLMDSLIVEDHQIEKITFTGVASIEGTEKANRKLFIKRGALIEGYIKRYYPDVPFQGDFYENFDDFRSGLVTEGYSDVTEVSDDTLRIFANDNRDDKEIARLLDQTRFSSVKVVYRDYFPIEEGSYGLSVERIKDLMAENQIKEIIPLYLVMANNAIEGDTAVAKELLELNFPNDNSYASLHWYAFLLELAVGESVVTAERLNNLKDIGAIKSDADYLEYRLLFNLFNGDNSIKVEDYDAVLSSSRNKRKNAWIECLDLILKVENYELDPDPVAIALLESVLANKFELRETYFVCQYLVRWGYTAEPFVLLSKYAKRPGQLPKLYSQYLKLGYFLGQFENDREWKKIRNVLRNLASTNPDEFCELFKWDQMGVRSLERKEIAELFCETCRDKEPLETKKSAKD